jgi:glucan 1,3-beta-glucosidase
MSDPYGAANDGSGDQQQAIQNAISANDRGQGVTTQPAQIFIPSGTYTIGSTLNLLMNTIIVGDPNDPPVLKAATGFNGDVFIMGYDKAAGQPETSFFTQLRNVIIDTTAIDGATSITALQWGVAQGCALGNVQIKMPTSSTGHTGINLQGGSTIAVTDTHIIGGAVGIQNSNQQVNFKNIHFDQCTTGFAPTGGYAHLLQNVTFTSCGFGVDMTKGGNPGDLVLLDAVSTNSGSAVVYHDSSNDSGDRNFQIVIQNLKHDTDNAIAQTSDGKTTLPATSTVDTWVWGNASPGNYQSGTSYKTTRSQTLLNGDGNYFTMDAPTYANLAADQIVNVKNVDGAEVKGDGLTDDSAALNSILLQAAADCKVAYFPYGVYVVKDTLVIPPNSRIVGEAFAVVSGAGDKFNDASKPVPVVQVGNSDAGTTGVAHISDMRFTVAEILPGAVIMEVNMAGAPGDVGIWNCLFTVGGTADSTVKNCEDDDTSKCMAAFLGLHLTASSSAYVQNVWVWTADHNLDGGPKQQISTGRGLLVEATKGTWLTGTSSEHNWLYNYNLHNAQSVFAGLQQTESPYMQGEGAAQLAPAPWTADTNYGDPDFSWCDGGDGKCRTSLAQNVDGGSDLFLHSSAQWNFFHGPWDGSYKSTACQGSCVTYANRISGNPSNLYWYGINTKSADVMVLDGKDNPAQLNNPGGWTPGGIVAAYLQFAEGSGAS